jgi:phage N-6-adenine-methyltransferase
MALLTSARRDNWRTPLEYIEAVWEVLGAIDLDPASCPEANEIICAHDFFTKEDDGLSRGWYGKVFCNPPYGKVAGKSMQALFAAKLVEEYLAGRVEEAILLVNLYYGYKWFAPLRQQPMCLPDHRIRFINPDTGEQGDEAKASSVFIYFGRVDWKIEKFYRVFSRFGWCGQLKREWHS